MTKVILIVLYILFICYQHYFNSIKISHFNYRHVFSIFLNIHFFEILISYVPLMGSVKTCIYLDSNLKLLKKHVFSTQAFISKPILEDYHIFLPTNVYLSICWPRGPIANKYYNFLNKIYQINLKYIWGKFSSMFITFLFIKLFIWIPIFSNTWI